MNWVVQGTRPGLAFDVMDFSTRLHKGTVSNLLLATKSMKRACQLSSSTFFPSLGMESNWKKVVYTDASFANLNP
jgi:hypothetical protein